MKKVLVFCLVTFVLCLSMSRTGVSDVMEKADALDATLRGRTHKTWEGEYLFERYFVIRIESQADICVAVYACKGHEGNVLEFFLLEEDGTPHFLAKAPSDRKGVTPTLEGIDVFPAQEHAELIVRWKDPGHGGSRTIQKYSYDSKSVRLVASAEYLGRGLGERWIAPTR